MMLDRTAIVKDNMISNMYAPFLLPVSGWQQEDDTIYSVIILHFFTYKNKSMHSFALSDVLIYYHG